MHQEEVLRSQYNTQSRNLQSQQNGNSNDDTTTLVRGAMDDDRRRKRFRQRVNKKSLNVGSASNSGPRTAGKLDANSELMRQERKQHEITSVDGKVMKTSNDFKDAYWYYDPKTDGFYYDSKGSRGWRRRNPAHEKKQLEDGDGLSCLWADPNFVAYGGTDPYGYQYNSIGHFSPHIQYYDPETDGYYFEMPSVDGWKKRQPHSVGSSSVMPPLAGYSNSRMVVNPNALPTVSQPSVADAMDVPLTSYGAALARGQLPPGTVRTSDAITNTSTNINEVLKDTFSTAELSFSTLSSNDDFNAACSVVSVYVHTLFDKTSAEWDKKGNNQGNCNAQKPFSYADIIASSCDTGTTANADDVENSTPPPQQIMASFSLMLCHSPFLASSFNFENRYKRPETLELHSFAEQNEVGRATNEQDIKRSGLTNFNADKFIADLPFNSTDRILRDLAALKTPCSVPVCNTDSPHAQSSVMKGLRSPLGIPNQEIAICDMEVVLNQILSCADEKEWVPERASAGTSKLNFWRNSGLVAGIAGVSCDNA
ncbi:unnamed protein product [Litomosoides sigmodontis]|uniref:Uncharacterized protein n=1 Tax=Litomosoides sigmodontis TaxID=42156 RepID=A0A3P6SRA1_LITSI|nr:unnamed protein product [Litomosoides sigmodontis]